MLLATHVLTFNTPGSVAASTLVAAALFSPLRRRVQRMVDRRFNRTRYDAEQTVAAFAARLQDAVDLGSVRDDLASVVQRALEPAHSSIWTSEGGQRGLQQDGGHGVGQQAGHYGAALLGRQGLELPELPHGAFTALGSAHAESIAQPGLSRRTRSASGGR